MTRQEGGVIKCRARLKVPVLLDGGISSRESHVSAGPLQKEIACWWQKYGL